VEEQVDAEEQADDPEARLGPFVEDQNAEEEIDQPLISTHGQEGNCSMIERGCEARRRRRRRPRAAA
jgi:hypothetical protein